MRGRDARPRPHSNLRYELKTYRNEHNLTQEQLAAILEVEARTLRRWESGETILSDVYELARIADCLGIPHERLGLAPLSTPGLEDLNNRIAHVWSLIQEGFIAEARTSAEGMVRQVQQIQEPGKRDFQRSLARLYHAAAHSTSLNVRTEAVDQAIYYYKQMEYLARLLQDGPLTNTALTYLGDMYRRKGDLFRALSYLEAAQSVPEAGTAALGNNLQLLARSYLRLERLQEFDTAIKHSEDLAHELVESSPSTQYHLTHVYEEYAKSYVALGKTQMALDYLELAEKHSPKTKSVEMLLKVARAEALIYSGDIRSGESLAVEAAIYTRAHGHYRRLERIYNLKRHISRTITQLGKAEQALSEVLDGPLEQ